MTTVNAKMVDTNEKGVVVQWTGADTNTGTPVATLGFTEITVQSVGDGTSVTMQGSNDGGTTWGALGSGVSSTVSGNAITRIAEHPALIRPLFVGGTSTVVYLSAAKQAY